MNDFFERHRILRRFAKVATTIVAIFLIYSIYEAIRTYINNQPEIVTKLENIGKLLFPENVKPEAIQHQVSPTIIV